MNFADVHFLEPPHQHNTDDLDIVIAKPPIADVVQTDLKDSLEEVYISTSIALASLKRQRHLYNDLASMYSRDADYGSARTFESECSRYGPEMRIRAEIFYFDDEAMPDWRHKALRLQSRLESPSLYHRSLDIWLITVRNFVRKWCDESQQLKDKLVFGCEESCHNKENQTIG
jgi:hypothetical protein